MTVATGFLFNGPRDGEVILLTDARAVKIEVCERGQRDILVYLIYSTNKIAGMACRIYKYQESYKDE